MAQQPWIGCCLKHHSIFSSGSHFVQQKVTNLAILVKVMQKHLCEILKTHHGLRRTCRSKVFFLF